VEGAGGEVCEEVHQMEGGSLLSQAILCAEVKTVFGAGKVDPSNSNHHHLTVGPIWQNPRADEVFCHRLHRYVIAAAVAEGKAGEFIVRSPLFGFHCPSSTIPIRIEVTSWLECSLHRILNSSSGH